MSAPSRRDVTRGDVIVPDAGLAGLLQSPGVMSGVCASRSKRRNAPALVLATTLLLHVVLVTIVAVLIPLAAASPPDPTWIAGFWDDGDFDDLVVLVLGIDGSPSPRCLLACPYTPVEPLSGPSHAASVVRLAVTRLPARAPPTV
jgi:hypothetical protein